MIVQRRVAVYLRLSNEHGLLEDAGLRIARSVEQLRIEEARRSYMRTAMCCYIVVDPTAICKATMC